MQIRRRRRLSYSFSATLNNPPAGGISYAAETSSSIMLRRILLVALLAPQFVQAESAVTEMKRMFDLTACLLNNTKTMCVLEEIARSQPSIVVEKGTATFGRSGNYYLVSGDSDWLQLWPKMERREDLVLIDKDGRALVEVYWEDGKQGDYRQAARQLLDSVIQSTNAEPTALHPDFWPFKDDGIIYYLCFRTEQNTAECMLSAAANLPNGFATIFATSAMDDVLMERVIQVIASLSVPES